MLEISLIISAIIATSLIGRHVVVHYGRYVNGIEFVNLDYFLNNQWARKELTMNLRNHLMLCVLFAIFALFWYASIPALLIYKKGQ